MLTAQKAEQRRDSGQMLPGVKTMSAGLGKGLQIKVVMEYSVQTLSDTLLIGSHGH